MLSAPSQHQQGRPSSKKITYNFLLDDAKTRLFENCDTPRIDAEVLIQHVVNQPLAWLIAYGDSQASPEHIKHFYELVEQRHQGQPIAYIIGERDFWTLSLSVNKNVLIPRPDTETLIESVLPLVSNSSTTNILDLGTGSGAIALSLAKEKPDSFVTATDFHQRALDVAIENSLRNNIGNVNFIQSDWFASLDRNHSFDLIVSNPPYIEENDNHLDQGDLRFEPISALVAKDNGLADLSSIIKLAPTFLKSKGWLALEHGYNQADSVTKLLVEHGFTNIRSYQDLNKLDRCTIAQHVNC